MAMFSEACLEAVGVTNQDKIKYLKQFSYLDREINRKIEELTYWRGKLEQVTSVLSYTPKGGGSVNKPGEIVAKIVDIEKELNNNINKLVEVKQEIAQTINEVEDEQLRMILYYRYINCKVWEQIAVDMGYGWRHIHKLHSKALSKIKMA